MGLQLHHFPEQNEWQNGKVAQPAMNRMFEQWRFHLTAKALSDEAASSAAGKWACGEYHENHHGSKKGKSRVTACEKLSRYTEVINLRIPHRGTASLAQVSTMGLCPLFAENS